MKLLTKNYLKIVRLVIKDNKKTNRMKSLFTLTPADKINGPINALQI